MLSALALLLSPVSFPRDAVAGQPWRVTLRAATAPTVVATGPATVRAKSTGRNGIFHATLRFPVAGTYRVRANATPLGNVVVDVARDPLILDPIGIGIDPAGALLVAQLRQGSLLRVDGGRATALAGGHGLYQVTSANGNVYAAADDGVVYRLDGPALTAVSPATDANAVAVDPAGNLYVTVYEPGAVERITPDGRVSVVADGFFHPHALVYRDGALYVADTENRRLRRVDLATGAVTTFGGDVGITVALAVGPDGSVYSADVVRDGSGGGITRTTPSGTTTRIVSNPAVNGVAVAPDGTVYVDRWEKKRIDRLDAAGKLQTVVRG